MSLEPAIVSCIITKASSSTSSTTENYDKKCVDASTHNGGEALFVRCETFVKRRPKRLSGMRNLSHRNNLELRRQPSRRYYSLPFKPNNIYRLCRYADLKIIYVPGSGATSSSVFHQTTDQTKWSFPLET